MIHGESSRRINSNPRTVFPLSGAATISIFRPPSICLRCQVHVADNHEMFHETVFFQIASFNRTSLSRSVSIKMQGNTGMYKIFR